MVRWAPLVTTTPLYTRSFTHCTTTQLIRTFHGTTAELICTFHVTELIRTYFGTTTQLIRTLRRSHLAEINECFQHRTHTVVIQSRSSSEQCESDVPSFTSIRPVKRVCSKFKNCDVGKLTIGWLWGISGT